MKNKDKRAIVKIISVAVLVILWINIGVMKYSNPDMSLKYPLIISIILSILGAVAFFGSFKSKKKEEEKEEEVPKAITEEERTKIIFKLEEKKWNNILRNGGITLIDKATYNKQDIYAYRVKMNLDDEEFIVILNANYPEQGLIELNKKEMDSEHYRRKRMQSASKGDFKEPDTEERTETDLKTGVKTKYKKTTQQRKKENKKKENELQ